MIGQGHAGDAPGFELADMEVYGGGDLTGIRPRSFRLQVSWAQASVGEHIGEERKQDASAIVI